MVSDFAPVLTSMRADLLLGRKATVEGAEESGDEESVSKKIKSEDSSGDGDGEDAAASAENDSD